MTGLVIVKKSFNINPRADEAAKELRSTMTFSLTDSINKGLVLLNTLVQFQETGARLIIKQDGEEDILLRII